MAKVIFKPEEIREIRVVATGQEAKDFRIDVLVEGAEPRSIRTPAGVKRDPLSRRALEAITGADKTRFNLSPQATKMLDDTVAALSAGNNPPESFLEIRIKDANPPQKPQAASSEEPLIFQLPIPTEEMAGMKSELLRSVMKPESEVDYTVLCYWAHGKFFRQPDELRRRLDEAAQTIGAQRRADVSLSDGDWQGELQPGEPEWKCRMRVADRLSKERGVSRYRQAAKAVMKDTHLESLL